MPCLRTRLRTVVARRRRRSRSPQIGERKIVLGDGVDVRVVRANARRQLRVGPCAAEAGGGNKQLQRLMSGAELDGRRAHGHNSFLGCVARPLAFLQAPGEVQFPLVKRCQAIALRIQMVASALPVTGPRIPAPTLGPAAGAVQHRQSRKGIRCADATQVVRRFAPFRLALRVASRSTNGDAQSDWILEHVAPNQAVAHWPRAFPLAVLRYFGGGPDEGVAAHVPVEIDPIKFGHAFWRQIAPQRLAEPSQPGQGRCQLGLRHERRQHVRTVVAVRTRCGQRRAQHDRAHGGRSNSREHRAHHSTSCPVAVSDASGAASVFAGRCLQHSCRARSR